MTPFSLEHGVGVCGHDLEAYSASDTRPGYRPSTKTPCSSLAFQFSEGMTQHRAKDCELAMQKVYKSAREQIRLATTTLSCTNCMTKNGRGARRGGCLNISHVETHTCVDKMSC